MSWICDQSRDTIYSLYLSHFQYEFIFTKSTNLTQLINATIFTKKLDVAFLLETSAQTFTDYPLTKTAIVDLNAQSSRCCYIPMNLLAYLKL